MKIQEERHRDEDKEVGGAWLKEGAQRGRKEREGAVEVRMVEENRCLYATRNRSDEEQDEIWTTSAHLP